MWHSPMRAMCASTAGTWAAGQGIGLIEDTVPCQVIMDRMIAEAEETIKERLSSLLTPAARM